VNVLCFAEVEDLFEIEYKEREGFTVRLENGKEIFFKRSNKMFVAEVADVVSVLTTKAEKKLQYSISEVKRAEAAHELLKNAGYPSAGELIHLLGDGNILDMPALTSADIVRSYDIFGQPAEYIRGKLTKKKVSRVKFDEALQSEESQTLWADVMHIDQQLFFVSIAEPMQLVMVNSIKREDAESLGEALQDQLGLLRERNFQPQLMYIDPASGLLSLRTQFPGVVIDVCGAGDHVSKVDIRIRRLKEMYRAVKAGLPWALPKSRIKDLVFYCTSRMNIRRTSAMDGTVCPRVLFTGRPVDYKKELLVAFGDYVEAYEGTDNTSRARSSACIALYPVGNSTGSWVLWKIETRSRVRRSNVTKLVTSDLIKQAMDAVTREGAQNDVAASTIEAETQQPAVVSETDGAGAVEEQIPGENLEEDPLEHQEADELERREAGESSSESVQEDVPDVEDDAEVVNKTRSGRRVVLPSRFMNVTKVKEWKTEAVDVAIKAELRMLFEELKALRCVKRASIKAGTKILKSHMFVVKKYLANGLFDKMKARLVVDGRDQDEEMYPNKSSPTVAVHSVFTALGLASGKWWRIVMKIDIKGAFVQTPMEGEVYMKVDQKMASYVINLFPDLKEMVHDDGCLYTLLSFFPDRSTATYVQ
jgi:hypothetical protein